MLDLDASISDLKIAIDWYNNMLTRKHEAMVSRALYLSPDPFEDMLRKDIRTCETERNLLETELEAKVRLLGTHARQNADSILKK